MKTRMKELREKLGITQAALANKVGVTRQTTLFLEKGKYNPSLRLVYKISRILNTSIEEIFSFKTKWQKSKLAYSSAMRSLSEPARSSAGNKST